MYRQFNIAGIFSYFQYLDTLRLNASNTVSIATNSTLHATMHSFSSVKRPGLMDLPTELLDQIVRYSITTEPITVSLAPTSGSMTRNLIPSVSRRKRYRVINYPYSLLLTNHLLSRLAFKYTWSRKPLLLSLTAAHALCFLQHELSPRQKEALCRVRLPRFLLSWTWPVNSDIWLIPGKDGATTWYEGAGDADGEAKGQRFRALVAMLGKRASCACQPWKLSMGIIPT